MRFLIILQICSKFLVVQQQVNHILLPHSNTLLRHEADQEGAAQKSFKEARFRSPAP